MKVKDAIAAADAVKPNAFSEETKFQWLRRLEGRLQAEVFLMAPAQIRELDLQYPADMDRELLVDPPTMICIRCIWRPGSTRRTESITSTRTP